MPSIANLLKAELLNPQLSPVEGLQTLYEASWFLLPLEDMILFAFKDYSFILLDMKRDPPWVNSGEIPRGEFQDFLIESINVLGRRAIKDMAERKLKETLK